MQNFPTFIKKIERYTEQEQLIPASSTIIIGLSGGPDSVFLLHFLASIAHKKNITLIAAHLDHGWRAESVNDARWCMQLAQKYSIPIVVKTVQELPLALKYNGSKEEIGRKARRYFFESLAQEMNAQAIALAHHADDQQETFFIRLMRGTSLAGLVGMQAKDGLYIRPLLQTKKQEVLEYLAQHQLDYLVDTSNTSDDFLRNRIRSCAIPALQKCDNRFDANFNKALGQLQQTEDFLDKLAHQLFTQVTGPENSLDLNAFFALHEIMRHRILILWLCTAKVSFTPSSALLNEIIRFLQKPTNGSHTIASWTIKKYRQRASISNGQQDHSLGQNL
jgi:tRNA(Ile)-lysidine synthase